MRSSFATYITIVIRRMHAELRRTDGRWNPSAEARRTGEAAVLLERLLWRDRREREEALMVAAAEHPELTRAQLEPFAALLARAERIVLVPDRSMENVAFAALYDTRRKQHLIERFEIAIAASGASLQRRGIEPLRTALALALPSNDLALPSNDLALPSNALARLPATEAELADVEASYASARRASGATLAELRRARADVVHIAGHTMREQGAGEPALALRVRALPRRSRPSGTRGRLVGVAATARRGDQRFGIERLGQNGGDHVGAKVVTGNTALGRGDDDFWHVWQRMRRETCHHIVAADARHAKVENDDAVFVGGEEVESFLPVACGVHGVETRATEERGSQVPERVVVINRKRGFEIIATQLNHKTYRRRVRGREPRRQRGWRVAGAGSGNLTDAGRRAAQQGEPCGAERRRIRFR